MPNWKKVVISGSNAELNSLNITTTLTASGLIYPIVDGDNGDFLITDGAGNLSFSRSTVFANVKNISGGTLQKGTPVHATGTAGNASEVIASSASVASTMPATYVLNETLADDAEGLAIIVGHINGVDTSTFGEGDIMYVGATGSFTNVKPQGSDNLIQNLGLVNKVHASNGSGYVYGSGRSNDIPNLPKSKIWVGSDTYTVTSSILTLDEDNSQIQITGSLDVSGSSTLLGNSTITGSLLISSSTSEPLTIYGSGSTLLEVIGSVGSVFSIDDSLSGSLLSVSDISGIPQFEVFSDGTLTIGSSPTSLYTTAQIVSTQTSTNESIYSISTSSYDGAWFEYTAISASNLRAGSVMSIWEAGTSNINFTETTTTDIGDTSGVTISAVITDSQAALQVNTTTPGWKLKTIVKSI